jgi:transcriptional regulator with XRE-family HTH domain
LLQLGKFEERSKGNKPSVFTNVQSESIQNYLKAYRLKSGLSQQDIANIMAYKDSGEVSRHERGETIPGLVGALAYEVIFRVPTAKLFAGICEVVERDIESKIRTLELSLEHRSSNEPGASLTAHKLIWLNERKKYSSR